MKILLAQLAANEHVSDYKINIHQKESCELFFVKGKLETVRRTDTCDKEVTVYTAHDGVMGDARFFVYPSTTEEDIQNLIEEAVEKALLLQNPVYTLPEGQTGSYQVSSNFSDYDPWELAQQVSEAVFAANTLESGTLNSVEIFINKHTESVINSRGLHKTQVRYDAMAETIPTYNGEEQSVELYHQYNFSALDMDALRNEVERKMQEVKARYEAVHPENIVPCKVILCEQETAELFWSFADDLSYSKVYSHANLYKKGDTIQTDRVGDPIGITMAGALPGCVRSCKFDSDGMALGSIRVIEDGKAVNYHGSNRFGQYLQETPTGVLRCMQADVGSAEAAQIGEGPYLQVISMSGLQVDFFSDYIGGEVRLAYYHDGESVRAVTGISISGKLSQVMRTIRLSKESTVYNSYVGPRQAILQDMQIF